MVQKDSDAADQRSVISVAWAAHKGAETDTGSNAEKFMQQMLPQDSFMITDQQPDIILFMSGGSERKAISMMQPGHPVLLLSIKGNNAYAAATEVMAWMVNNNRFAILSDAAEASESGLIDRWCRTVTVWNSLRGQKAGLIGSVSDWLVASDVPDERLLNLLGVTLERIPWITLTDYSEQEPDVALLHRFNDQNTAGLVEAAKVLTILRRLVEKNELNAIAVECFSLVQQRKVTACLALAQLNNEGMVAACEGDLASMAGMMLLKAATGSVPWLANTTSTTNKRLLLSHCTIAFDLVSDIKLATHFETDLSLAINGKITSDDVTVFRFSDKLDRAFIAEGKVTGHPDLTNACRTQVEIELPSQSLALLRTQPLGNHLLMAPGKYADLLRLVCNYKGIRVLESN
jgi:L-fucose isomerase-like protein